MSGTQDPVGVAGPLIQTPAAAPTWLSYEVPSKRCTECGRRLAPTAAHFYGGIHSGVTWTLRCTNGHEFEWSDYVCGSSDEYDCGFVGCPARQKVSDQ